MFHNRLAEADEEILQMKAAEKNLCDANDNLEAQHLDDQHENAELHSKLDKLQQDMLKMISAKDDSDRVSTETLAMMKRDREARQQTFENHRSVWL